MAMNIDLSTGSSLGNVCTSARRISDVVAVVGPAPVLRARVRRIVGRTLLVLRAYGSLSHAATCARIHH
jgi:hypothetical protein